MFACLAGLAVLLFPAHDREPRYHNRPLRYWTGLYFNEAELSPVPPAQRELASDAIRHIGTNVIPYLLDWFAYDHYQHLLKRDALQRRFPTKIRTNDTFRRFYHPETERRRAACAAFALIALGPQAEPAIPDLARYATSSNTPYLSRQATGVLLLLGTPAVPALTAAATDPQNPNRRFLIQHLDELGTNAHLVTATLTNLLNDPDAAIRSTAQDTLVRIVTANTTTTPPR